MCPVLYLLYVATLPSEPVQTLVPGFARSGQGPRTCISSTFPGEADAARPGCTLRIAVPPGLPGVRTVLHLRRPGHGRDALGTSAVHPLPPRLLPPRGACSPLWSSRSAMCSCELRIEARFLTWAQAGPHPLCLKGSVGKHEAGRGLDGVVAT